MSQNSIILCLECGTKNKVPLGTKNAKCGKCSVALAAVTDKSLRAPSRYEPSPTAPSKLKRKSGGFGRLLRLGALAGLAYVFFGDYVVDWINKNTSLEVSESSSKSNGLDAGIRNTLNSENNAYPQPSSKTSSSEASKKLPEKFVEVDVIYTESQIEALKAAFIGLSASDRKRVQNALKTGAYYTSSVDGLWGAGTSKGIVEYGQDNKIRFESQLLLDALIASDVSSKTNELWYRSNKKRQAPFAVSTSTGSDYYVKLRDAQTKMDVLGIFIKGGESYDTKAPLGKFELVYATGKNWLGEGKKFGPETRMFKTDKTLIFEIQGNQIKGSRISLIKVKDGNLKSIKMSDQDF